MRKPRIKLPGQSWTIKEKLDVVNALCADRRFTYGETVAAVTMVLYFHNTTSGDLFPSREQVSERCGVTKHVIISATRKMKRLGYLHYEQSSGGRNERNTYHLMKDPAQTVQNLHPLPNETVQNLHPPSAEFAPAPVQNLHPHIPLESTTGKEEGSALPLPRKGEASASPEEKEKEGFQQKEEREKEGYQGKVVSLPAEPFLSKEERDRRLAEIDKLKLKLGSKR